MCAARHLSRLPLAVLLLSTVSATLAADRPARDANRPNRPAGAEKEKVGRDSTPLLYDRVKPDKAGRRPFPAVVVATLPDGFVGKATAVPNSNAVALPVTVERVLAGDVKPGGFRVHVHNRVPAELAARDAGSDHRYLLALMPQDNRTPADASDDWGWLGTASFHGDVDRFILAGLDVETLVLDFMDMKDADPSAAELAKFCAGWLEREHLSDEAGRHVLELLARAVERYAGGEGRDDVQRAVDLALARGAAGHNLESVALVAVAAPGPAGLRVYEEKAAGAMRAELGRLLERAAAAENPAAPDWPAREKAARLIAALGGMKDFAAPDLLILALEQQGWKNLHDPARAALTRILGDAAPAVLAKYPKRIEERVIE